MSGDDRIQARAILVRQPIGEFYCCAIAAADVLNIAHADIRRIKQRDIEMIVGIQRELKERRVKEIKQYVKNIDAAFPSSVILAISSEHAHYDDKKRVISIVREPAVAKIIDGQHRIAGLDGFVGHFDLICTVFIDMDEQDAAMTFATINLAQTRVSKSLVYDLFAVQKARSPQKTCHQIARLLNRESDSPLFSRIKILGKATGEPLQFLTQATFVERLLPYISDDPMRDRDAINRGGMKKLPTPPQGKQSSLILRSLFAQEKDDVIADAVWNYFDAVSDRWSEAWNSDERGSILNRSQGFAALMRFFKPVYLAAKSGTDGTLSFAAARKIFASIKLRDRDFTVANYAPGTSGETSLYHDLLEHSGLGE